MSIWDEFLQSIKDRAAQTGRQVLDPTGAGAGPFGVYGALDPLVSALPKPLQAGVRPALGIALSPGTVGANLAGAITAPTAHLARASIGEAVGRASFGYDTPQARRLQEAYRRGGGTAVAEAVDASDDTEGKVGLMALAYAADLSNLAGLGAPTGRAFGLAESAPGLMKFLEGVELASNLGIRGHPPTRTPQQPLDQGARQIPKFIDVNFTVGPPRTPVGGAGGAATQGALPGLEAAAGPAATSRVPTPPVPPAPTGGTPAARITPTQRIVRLPQVPPAAAGGVPTPPTPPPARPTGGTPFVPPAGVAPPSPATMALKDLMDQAAAHLEVARAGG